MTPRTSVAVPHLQLGAPPRAVSRELRVRMWLSSSTQMACGFLAFGSVFLWGFVMRTDLSGPLFWGEVRTVTGVVDSVGTENASINKRKVTRYDYHFDLDGQRHHGASYAHDGPSVGRGPVTIEVAATPSISRIRGLRRDAFPAPAAIVAVLPALGVWVLVRTLARMRTWLRLLREGESGTARLVRKERDTEGGSKKNVPWTLVYAFDDERGQTREHIVEVHEVGRLTDEAEEPILYERGGGAVALLDELPGHPRLREDGSIRLLSNAPLWTLAIIPGALVAIHLLGALAVFG